MDLLEERFLAPVGTDTRLLAGNAAFLAPGAPGEDRVLAAQQLGVTMLSDERFLVSHVLPRCSDRAIVLDELHAVAEVGWVCLT